MIYVVNLYFFLKLPGNILGAAYNQVRFIVRNLRYTSMVAEAQFLYVYIISVVVQLIPLWSFRQNKPKSVKKVVKLKLSDHQKLDNCF